MSIYKIYFSGFAYIKADNYDEAEDRLGKSIRCPDFEMLFDDIKEVDEDELKAWRNE